MSLRSRLFLFFGGFIALLVGAQWLLMESLSRDLAAQTDWLAMQVGASVAQVMTVDLSCDASSGEACPETVQLFGPTRGSFDVEGMDVRGGGQGAAPASVADDVQVSQAFAFSFHASGDAPPASHRIFHLTPELQRIHEQLEDEPQNMVVVVKAGDRSGARRLVERLEGVELGTDAPVGRWVERRSTTTRDGKTVLRIKRMGPDGQVEESEQVVGAGSEPAAPHFAMHGHGSVQGHDQAGGEAGLGGLSHEDHEIFFSLDGGPGTRFLTVEQPDRVSQVPIPQANRSALERFQRRLWLGSGVIVALGLLVAAWLAHRVSTPLRRLSTAATEIGDGAFGTRVVADTGDREVRNTVDAFNHMSARLAELDAETRRLETLRHMGELGDVARGLAHTLRNPLNALGLSVEELAARNRSFGGEPDEEDGVDGLVESARRQIRRIDRGIRSFLLLASQSGGVVEEVNVGSLVEDVALEALQDNPGRHLELHIAPGPTPLTAVEPELRAVVQALVVNALEASPAGGIVDVHLEPSADGRVTLRVDDHGPGLAPEIRERLFTPHLSTKANGSGMGLFLAHRIAGHRYGGRLELLDRDVGGTRAELEIGPRCDGREAAA